MKQVVVRNLELIGAAAAPVFIATTQRLSMGERFLLALNKKAWPNSLVIAVTVTSVQPARPRHRQRAGVWVQLDALMIEKIEAFDAAAKRGAPLVRRRHDRLPVTLPVLAHFEGRTVALFTKDISLGGAALLGQLPADVTTLMLEIPSPGEGLPISVAAKLVHRRVDRHGQWITGAQFITKTSDGALRISEVLRRIIAAL